MPGPPPGISTVAASDASGWVNDGLRFDGTMNYPFTAATIAYAVGDRLDPATRLDNADYSVAPAIDSSAYRDRIEWILGWYNDAATTCGPCCRRSSPGK